MYAVEISEFFCVNMEYQIICNLLSFFPKPYFFFVIVIIIIVNHLFQHMQGFSRPFFTMPSTKSTLTSVLGTKEMSAQHRSHQFPVMIDE